MNEGVKDEHNITWNIVSGEIAKNRSNHDKNDPNCIQLSLKLLLSVSVPKELFKGNFELAPNEIHYDSVRKRILQGLANKG